MIVIIHQNCLFDHIASKVLSKARLTQAKQPFVHELFACSVYEKLIRLLIFC